jgi:DNA-binding response OmpR family regulator
MRIAIHTSSAAIRRVLEQAVLAAGHRLATPHEPTDLTLIDTLHAATPGISSGTPLRLGGTSATEDCIPCPIHPNTLIQRLAMRSQIQSLPLGGGWELDALLRTLSHNSGERHSLTEKECQLLRSMVTAAPNKLAREALLESVWGVGDNVDTHTLETHIYRLRSKLGVLSPTPGDIVTEGGAYRFVTKN